MVCVCGMYGMCGMSIWYVHSLCTCFVPDRTANCTDCRQLNIVTSRHVTNIVYIIQSTVVMCVMGCPKLSLYAVL